MITWATVMTFKKNFKRTLASKSMTYHTLLAFSCDIIFMILMIEITICHLIIIQNLDQYTITPHIH